jgi:hypothetical protein
MKVRHNKKRNTAFVYEALLREATVAILKNEHERKDKAISIIKKYFKSDSILRKDLDCYRSLYENQNLDRLTCEKILKEVKLQKRLIDPNGLFKQQTELIHDVNKELEPSIFNNFVPNYRTLATISQIFSSKISPKNQVILENEIIRNMLNEGKIVNNTGPIDNVVYKTFVEKFNKKYESGLLEEQKRLLTHYIASFADNGVELKFYLNEEIARLKIKLKEAIEISEIKSDKEMIEKTNQVIEKLNSFAKQDINEELLITVLKTQSLVKEIHDGNHG